MKICPNCKIEDLKETNSYEPLEQQFYFFNYCEECDHCEPVHKILSLDAYKKEYLKQKVNDGHNLPITITMSNEEWIRVYNCAYMFALKDGEDVTFIEKFGDLIRTERSKAVLS